MSSKPPFAAYIWADDTAIFLELPAASGRLGHITRLALTDGGIGKALKIIRACASTKGQPVKMGSYPFAERPKTTFAKAALPEFTDAQRAAARDVIRRFVKG